MGWYLHLVVTIILPTIAVAQEIWLNATESGQTFTSPNYPSDYTPDSDLYWLIRTSHLDNSLGEWVVNINIQYLRIESHATCDYDYLKIYDGTLAAGTPPEDLCGEFTQVQISFLGSNMFFHFHSDSNVNLQGFSIQYWATYTAYAVVTKPTPFDNTPFYIIGGVLGGVVLLSVIGIVIYCVFRVNYKKDERTKRTCRKSMTKRHDGKFVPTYKTIFKTKTKTLENAKLVNSDYNSRPPTFDPEPRASTSTQPSPSFSGVQNFRVGHRRPPPPAFNYVQPGGYPENYNM